MPVRWCFGLIGAILAACGGGEPEVTVHPPIVSSLKYSPSAAVQKSGGIVTVNGTVEFTDQGADVAFLRIVSGAGVDVTLPTPAIAGSTVGTLTFSVAIATDGVDERAFELWVIDSRGSFSNHLTGTFNVVLPSSIPVPELQGNSLFGAVWSGSQYIAVGEKGTVLISPDLLQRTVQSSGVAHTLVSVAWSGSQYVAVGNIGNVPGLGFSAPAGVILTSADGVTWETRYEIGSCANLLCQSRAGFAKVTWAGTQFIAAGYESSPSLGPGSDFSYPLILTSPDGINWTRREIHYTGCLLSELTGMTWSGSLLVVVGSCTSDIAAPGIWTSMDGVTWAQTPVKSLPSVGRLQDVSWGNGQFVAIPRGATPKPALVSADGTTWRRSTDTMQAMYAVTSSGSDYMAVGDLYRMTSTDGLTWNTTLGDEGCGKAVLWDGHRYVGFGSSICTWELP